MQSKSLRLNLFIECENLTLKLTLVFPKIFIKSRLNPVEIKVSPEKTTKLKPPRAFPVVNEFSWNSVKGKLIFFIQNATKRREN